MSIGFDPTQQRGHASNPGRWKAYENSAPEAGLGMKVIDREREAEAARVMAEVERSSRRFASSYRMDDQTREDIAQDTAFDLLNQQKMFGLDQTYSTKLVRTAVRAVASRYIDPNVRHEDLTARALFKKVVAGEERRLGRELISREKKDIADDIRENAFAPGGRPGEFYYLENRGFSMDRPVNSGDGTTTTFGEMMSAEELEAPFAGDESALADIVDGLSLSAKDKFPTAGGVPVERVTPAQVRRDAWNHLSEISDAPKAQPGRFEREAIASLGGNTNPRQVKSAIAAAVKPHRDAVAAHGGAAALAAAWERGDTTPAQDRALFAPFGDLSIRDQEKVAGQLLRKPDYADDLWNSAADIAARPAAG